MIRHVVMWTVKGESRAERMMGTAAIEAAFKEMEGRIPGMLNIEVGIDAGLEDGACDIVLIADFASPQDLSVYASHPEHRRVRDKLAGLRLSRHCVDFEVIHDR